LTAERARVGDVLRLDRELVEPDPIVEYVTIGVRSFGKGIFHYEPRLGDQLGSLRFFRTEPDRLVLSNIKGWEGAIAVSGEGDAGCLASNRFLSYVPVDGLIDVGWACWYFLSDRGLELIQQASPGSADRNRTLAIDRFESLEIPLPPIEEQRRVADRLDRLQTAATELARRSERGSQLMGALAVSASSRPDLDEREKTRAGWRRLPLADLMALHNDEVQVEGAVEYSIAGVYSFGRGMFARTALDGSQTSYKVLHRLHAGQLVMSRLKAWEGALAVVPTGLDGWFLSPEFPTFDIDTRHADTGFIGAVINSERFWTRLKGASQGIGARRERVNASRLLEQEIDLPPLDDQMAIGGMIDHLEEARMRRERARDRIGALVPAALNRAFAGLN
jgi:type I restriction enzyme S subunit